MASLRGSRRGKQQEEEKSASLSDVNLGLTQSITVAGVTLHYSSGTQDSGSAHTETATKPSAAITATTKDVKRMDNEPTSLMEFSCDLSEAEAPAPLPVGEYPATIVKAEIKDSKAGNKYLALMFHIDPESYPADFTDGNPEGETLPYNRVVLVDNGMGRYRVRKFNESVGAPTNTNRVDPNDYMGLTATVGIAHDTWEGERRAQIAKVLAA